MIDPTSTLRRGLTGRGKTEITDHSSTARNLTPNSITGTGSDHRAQ